MGRINIIMTSFNGAEYIQEQIESILASRYTDWVLDVFDDGSSDATLKILQNYTDRYPEKISFYKNKTKLGCSANYLTGLKNRYNESALAESSQYFMFCDQDDVWMPDKLELTLDLIKRVEHRYGNSSPALVFTDAVVADEKLGLIHPSFMKQSRLNPKETDLSHLLMENKCIGCTVMMNRALVAKLTKLPKSIKQHDWWMALLAAGFGHIAFLNRGTLYYRQHGNNEVGAKGFLSYCINRVTSLKKQRTSLLILQKQAEEFYSLYGDQLSADKQQIVSAFFRLNKSGWLNRRQCVIKYKFYKSGFIRNLGVFLLL